MEYVLTMRHDYPNCEEGLHDRNTTCPCGCEISSDDEGNMVVKHTPFDIMPLLVEADNLMQNRVLPSVAEFKRFKS